MNIAALLAERAKHADKMRELAGVSKFTAEQQAAWDEADATIVQLNAQIERVRKVQDMEAKGAVPVAGQGVPTPAVPVPGHNGGPALVETDPYVKDKSLIIGGMLKMFSKAKGLPFLAEDYAKGIYGESHPVTEALGRAKALNTTTGASGGFVVPPDFAASIIPLLYNKTAVRKAGCLTMDMPNGTMTIPKMTGGSSAYWVGEGLPIGPSQPAFGVITAVAKKLAALVPVTNDQMRYALATFDSMVRDDLTTQIALAEDSAFLSGNGLAFMPKGLDALVLNSNKFPSNPVWNFSTINAELTLLVSTLETANIPMTKGAFIMAPRTKNALMNLQDANGRYIYRDEMRAGTLNGYPFLSTAQIPINVVTGANGDTTKIYFADFGQCMILESRSLEFAISSEASYVDASGNTASAFQNDLTLIRGIMAEDFQVRYDQAITTLSGVRWGM